MGIVLAVLLVILGLLEFARADVFNAFLLFMAAAAFYFSVGYHTRTYICALILKMVSSGKKQKDKKEKATDDDTEDFLK